ncbi:MAG: hypothetical protein JKY37_03335 [Nannocystaceae bacterium]|nr:hypothetical protein [Nannocystaceae bacterium]
MRTLWVSWALAWLSGAAVVAGCVLEVPNGAGKPGPCGGRACSSHGYCERAAAQCRCDEGFHGNPYAAYGCQPQRPQGECATSCGLGAHCDGEGCVCADGYVAVCGTGDCLPESGLCDGVADCANGNDERPDVCFESVVMTWVVRDECLDGVGTQWRLWAADRGWVWPGPDATFETRGLDSDSLDSDSAESIDCLEGELVCFGGSAGGIDWGVGVSGGIGCEDCCETCRAVTIDYGALACD